MLGSAVGEGAGSLLWEVLGNLCLYSFSFFPVAKSSSGPFFLPAFLCSTGRLSKNFPEGSPCSTAAFQGISSLFLQNSSPCWSRDGAGSPPGPLPARSGYKAVGTGGHVLETHLREAELPFSHCCVSRPPSPSPACARRQSWRFSHQRSVKASAKTSGGKEEPVCGRRGEEESLHRPSLLR